MIKTNTDIKTISPSAKVWIHSFFRSLTEKELSELNIILEHFVNNWKSNNKKTLGHYVIPYNQFVVIANENDLSGCAIDLSFKTIKNFQQNIFKKEKINNSPKLFYKNLDNRISFTERYKIPKLIKTKKIVPNTIIFDSSITTWSDYQIKWEIPAHNSWVKQYF